MGRIRAFKTLVCLFVFLVCAAAFAQTEISGRIKSVSGETLPGASVLLKDKEQKIVSYVISGDTGGYQLEAKNTGEYHSKSTFWVLKKVLFLLR